MAVEQGDLVGAVGFVRLGREFANIVRSDINKSVLYHIAFSDYQICRGKSKYAKYVEDIMIANHIHNCSEAEEAVFVQEFINRYFNKISITFANAFHKLDFMEIRKLADAVEEVSNLSTEEDK
jgi:hypothetical protein